MADSVAAGATELETLLVRLMADASQYHSTMQAAEADAVATVQHIDAEVKRLGAVAARANEAAVSSINAHKNSIRELGQAYEKDLIDQYAYVRAVDKETIAIKELVNADQAATRELQRTVTTAPAAAAVINTYNRAIEDLNNQLRFGIISFDAYRARVETLTGSALKRVRAATAEYRAEVARAAAMTEVWSREIEQNNRVLQAQVTATNRARMAVMQEGIAVTEQAMTSTQRHAARVAQLDGLLAAGAITQGTYNQAVAMAAHNHANLAGKLMATQTILGGLQGVLTATGRLLTVGITAPAAAFAALGVHEFAAFDDAMNRTFAVMGDVSEEVRRQMKATATEISNNSITGATELARAYYTLAQAGLDAAQSQTALNIVNKFAVAGNMDLQHAAERLIDVQRTLGMESADPLENAKALQRVADVVMRASVETQASAEDFAKSLSTKVGAKARQLGKDIEEVTAALMAYASQGVKAQLAGEQGYIVLRDLTTAALKNKEAWDTLGVSVYDEAHNVKNVAEIIEDLTLLMAGLNDEQKVATMAALGFKDRSSAATNTLLGLGEAMKKFEAQLRGATGDIDRISEAIEGSFLSQIKETWNQLKNVGREVGEVLAPYITMLNGYIRDAIKWWHGLSAGTKETLVFIVGLAAAVGPLLVALGAAVGVVAGVVAGIGAFVALGPEVLAAVAAIAATAATWAAWGAAIVAAIGVVVAAWYDPDGFVGFAEKLALWIYKAQHVAMRLMTAWAGWINGPLVVMVVEGLRNGLYAGFKLVLDGLMVFVNGVFDVLEGKLSVQQLLDKIFPSAEDFARGFKERNFLKTAADIVREEFGVEVKDAVAETVEGVAKVLEDANPAVTSLEKGTRDLSTELDSLSKAGKEAAKEMADLIEKQKEMEDTYGMTRRQVLIYKMETAGVAKAEIDAAKAFDEKMSALEEFDKLLDRMIKEDDKEAAAAARLAEKHAAPLEKLAKEQSEVEDLFKKGLISAEAYHAEMKEIADKVAKLEGTHEVRLKFEGGQAVDAGSAEAINRVNAFLNSGAAGVPAGAVRGRPVRAAALRTRAIEKADIKALETGESPAPATGTKADALVSAMESLTEGIKINTDTIRDRPTVELEAAGL